MWGKEYFFDLARIFDNAMEYYCDWVGISP
jgi:hypothetical protein